MKTCKGCSEEFEPKAAHQQYCSKTCQWKKSRERNQSVTRRERRIELIDTFGGECQQCGYRKNYASLHFHHKRDKVFSLNNTTMSAMAFDKLVAEANKCLLLCGNCHMELHHPQLDRKKTKRTTNPS